MRTVGIELEYGDIRPCFLAKHLPDGWETLGDSSIKNSDGTWSLAGSMSHLGAEVRTLSGHPLDWYDGVLDAVLQPIANLGGVPNRTCGLHVHVGTFPAERELLIQIARYFQKNPVAKLAKATSLRRGRALRPIDDILIHHLETQPLETLEGMASWHVDGRHNVYREREVNVLSVVKRGTLEYRMFASTLKREEILASIQWCLELTEACLSGGNLPQPKGPLPPPIR